MSAYLDVAEFAKLAGMPPSAVYRLLDECGGPPREIREIAKGRTKLLIPRRAGLRWIEAYKARGQRNEAIERRSGAKPDQVAREVQAEFVSATKMRRW